MALRREQGSFAQGKCFVELLRGKSKNLVAMRSRHSEYKIGICGNRGGELSCCEVGCFATQLLEDNRGIAVNGMRYYRARSCARYSEFRKVMAHTVRDRKSFGRRRTTDVSSTDEQYMQSKLLQQSTIYVEAAFNRLERRMLDRASRYAHPQPTNLTVAAAAILPPSKPTIGTTTTVMDSPTS
jgi:hypothetical protein